MLAKCKVQLDRILNYFDRRKKCYFFFKIKNHLKKKDFYKIR